MQKPIVVAVVVLILGYLLWPSGDEPPPERRSDKSAAATTPKPPPRPGSGPDRHFDQRAPWDRPPDAGPRFRPLPGERGPQHHRPQDGAMSYAPGAPIPYGAPQQPYETTQRPGYPGYGNYNSGSGYRFRPLDEKSESSRRYSGGYPDSGTAYGYPPDAYGTPPPGDAWYDPPPRQEPRYPPPRY